MTGDLDPSLELRLSEASELADDGEWEAALELLLEEERSHPNDATLLCMIGIAFRETDADAVAYDYFRRCLAQDPLDPQLLITVGSELARWDDPDAERALRLAALSSPDLAAARLEYGAYLAREGHLQHALEELTAARELEPADVRLHVELGVALFLANRGEEASAAFGEAISLSPDDDWIQAVHGLSLADAGDLEACAEQLRLASLARLEDWELHCATALATMAVEWESEAWTALARADAVPEADGTLVRDVEELIEAGPEAAAGFLKDELGPSLLRQRLADRP